VHSGCTALISSYTCVLREHMKSITLLLFGLIFTDPTPKETKKYIVITNQLDVDRVQETVSIKREILESFVSLDKEIQVTDEAGSEYVCQLVDLDMDGKTDELLFQIDIAANSEKKFLVKNGRALKASSDLTTYARFVPERIDDFAWENDRVAFRTYGPTAQKITEDKNPGGTLSSGMDCWLKRVSHPVIDKWYKQNTEGKSYHKDHGEGYDPYHVGASRGTGGIGVWQNDSLYVSKNFTSYKIIANGPLRTIFELTYAPWTANGITIQEKKRISLDLGSQLSRYEISLNATASLPNCTAGVTLHDKKGIVTVNKNDGWCSYWEPMDDSELGTGIVVLKSYADSFQDFRTEKKDLSQVYAIMAPKDNQVIYYAGFGWKKAGRFNTSEEWNKYLSDFSKKIASPLDIKIKIQSPLLPRKKR
jgi:hypothetical protein